MGPACMVVFHRAACLPGGSITKVSLAVASDMVDMVMKKYKVLDDSSGLQNKCMCSHIKSAIIVNHIHAITVGKPLILACI